MAVNLNVQLAVLFLKLDIGTVRVIEATIANQHRHAGGHKHSVKHQLVYVRDVVEKVAQRVIQMVITTSLAFVMI